MPSNTSSSGFFLVAAAMSAFFMGTIGTISFYAGVSAEAVTFYRLFFGAMLMGGYLLLTGQREKIMTWPGFKVLITGAFLSGFVVFYILAMSYTSMANAIMLIYLAPVTASIVAHFLMGERLSTASVGLILLALLGFAMMMEFQLTFGNNEDEALGILYGFCSMLCYAAFMLTNRLIEERVHVLTRSGYQMFAGALCILPMMLQQADSISGQQWGWLAVAGLIPGFFAIVLAVVALRALPAATFGTLAYLEPITVVALGWVLFDQTLNGLQLSGCALIVLSGIAQAVLIQSKSEPAAVIAD
ncbi:DMT family transporter [Oceanospirillum maris]|uniref:DMT family transporter n=1 Tax=Oceanospirillum maris TaxID=64977 RepID=UPI00040E37B8|nr:EamA family transporter [Oceanospirillum maris]